jgi:hypothetical protein
VATKTLAGVRMLLAGHVVAQTAGRRGSPQVIATRGAHDSAPRKADPCCNI